MVASLSMTPQSSALDGPGVPNLRYDPSEVFTVIGSITARDGAPRAHGNASMIHGYLAVIFSRDGGLDQGGFAFYDISNPRCPRLVSRKDDAETNDLREAHGYGFTRVSGRDVVVLQATRGVQFWDWTDVTHPVRLSYLLLPGVRASDYSTGAWWAFYQAPFVYVGGSSNGIYIVDASDPRSPVLVDRGAGRPNPIPNDETGGFRLGPVFAVGNLLVATNMNAGGYATFDVGDPRNPVLLRALSNGAPQI
ncbi:MAG: hypothetical protein HY292_04830 [Planctomycetes bacterium]|nr:hypothetical protein [Planctomycetota bacterium]